MPQRVAIIGAGPCGLSQLHAFQQAEAKGQDIPELGCFEKQSDWGGLWNYDWHTGIGPYGEPVHGSMYRCLWSNGPKECLEFSDYTFDEHFKQPMASFPPREVLYDYLTGRAKQGHLRRYIQFNTAVKFVEYADTTGTFEVRVQNFVEDRERTEVFDYVIVCTGHFSVPHVPHFEGIDRFPGRVMHAHDFRDAREFTAQHLLVIGASYSAEDLALQSLKYGAASVTTCYRTKPMGFDWPEGITERPLLTQLEGKTAHFKDGSSKDVDAIVLCTGYLHHFPFLEEGLRLKTHNRLYPPGLYKGIFWEANPKLMYLGMQDQFYTFSMFDIQAWYARDVLLGRIAMPSKAEMANDIAQWIAREEQLADPSEQIDFQTDYMKDLHRHVDYPAFDIDMAAAHFKKWEHDKAHRITGYRDQAFTSPCTGTQAPLPPTPWLKAMDDSMVSYLRTGTA